MSSCAGLLARRCRAWWRRYANSGATGRERGRFRGLTPLAQAWAGRSIDYASAEELATLVRTLEPRFDYLNGFLEDLEEDEADGAPEIQALRHLADLFDVAAFDDEIRAKAFPGGGPA